MIFISLGVLVLIFALFALNYKTDGQEAKERLESIEGSSLYQVSTGYDELISRMEVEGGSTDWQGIRNELKQIEGHSTVIDQAVGEEVLSPVAKNLSLIVEKMEKEDKVLPEVIEEIRTLQSEMEKVYYVPESTEGAKPTLDIEDPKELKKINKRLSALTG